LVTTDDLVAEHSRVGGVAERSWPLPEAPVETEPLTDREREVLSCIGQGLSIKQAASGLGIKYFTVYHHIKAVYRKLCIRTRAQAATEAARRGLL